MIKPDYIPFSQEIFDEIESIRVRICAEPKYAETKECKERIEKITPEAILPEYNRYIREYVNIWTKIH